LRVSCCSTTSWQQSRWPFRQIIDSRTIVVERIDAAEVVHLTNVNVPAEDEQAARAYIQEMLAGTYVYVENGNVYRSPTRSSSKRELAFGAYGAPPSRCASSAKSIRPARTGKTGNACTRADAGAEAASGEKEAVEPERWRPRRLARGRLAPARR